MRRVCSYCKVVIDEGEGPLDEVSHGCCRPCFIEQKDKFDEWRLDQAAAQRKAKNSESGKNRRP